MSLAPNTAIVIDENMCTQSTQFKTTRKKSALCVSVLDYRVAMKLVKSFSSTHFIYFSACSLRCSRSHQSHRWRQCNQSQRIPMGGWFMAYGSRKSFLWRRTHLRQTYYHCGSLCKQFRPNLAASLCRRA